MTFLTMHMFIHSLHVKRVFFFKKICLLPCTCKLQKNKPKCKVSDYIALIEFVFVENLNGKYLETRRK